MVEFGHVGLSAEGERGGGESCVLLAVGELCGVEGGCFGGKLLICGGAGVGDDEFA